MATYGASPGDLRRVRLEVPVRAWWSRTRAWHGDEVAMNVETAYLPDHTPFSVHVQEAVGKDLAATPTASTNFIDERRGELVNNRATILYTLRWDRASLGRPLVLRGGRFEFTFEVHIDAPVVRARSNLLYVHLHPYVVSG